MDTQGCAGEPATAVAGWVIKRGEDVDHQDDVATHARSVRAPRAMRRCARHNLGFCLGRQRPMAWKVDGIIVGPSTADRYIRAVSFTNRVVPDDALLARSGRGMSLAHAS